MIHPTPGADKATDELTDRQKAAILHDYPTWMKFWHKHALGPLAAPSCIVCGQMTSTPLGDPHPSDAVIQHGELPAIVVCRCCRDLTRATLAAVPASEPVKLTWPEVSAAAQQANQAFGQWMPEHWVQAFVKAYNKE